MRRPAPLVRLSVLISIATVFGSLCACSNDPDARKRSYFASAERYAAEKKYDEAIVEYRNALQQDPMYADARFKLAEVYVAKGDYRSAYPEYIRAADLKPDDLRIQARAGNMLLLGRRFEEARARARIMLQKDPSNLEGLILLGNALAGLGDLPSAVQIAERAVAADPRREGTHVNLGVMHLAGGNQQEAEHAFSTAVRLNPNSLSANLALANFYYAAGRFEPAEAAFKRAAALAPNDVRTNRAVAGFYLGSGRPNEAAQYLLNVAERSGDPSSWFDLADFYVQQRRTQDAMRILGRLAGDPAQHANARRRMALIAHGDGRRAEAFSILDDLLSRDPNAAETLTIRARLLLADHRYGEALENANAAVRSNPRSAQAHLIAGLASMGRGDFAHGRRALTESINLDPGLLESRLALANLHLSTGEIDPAVDIATAATVANPGSLEARLLVTRALLVRPDDRQRALAYAEATVRDFPQSAAARNALALYYLAVGNQTAARREFEHALRLDAGFVNALADLVSMDVAAGRIEDARKLLRAHRALLPNDPRVRVLEAKLAIAARQMPEAERILREIVSLPKPPSEAYTLLGRMFIAQGRLAEATNEFSELLKKDPGSVAGHVMVGLLLHARRDTRGAIEHYEKAVALDPRTAAAAANNLAWLYAESGENLDRALELAQTARSHLPTDAEPLDTLGWVYLKKGMMSQAQTFIRQAIDLNPNNPLYHYHLGVLYAQKGDDASARTSLQRALELQPGEQIARDAKRILSTLVY
jgi:tetratricopeptide (TPR) repeat protein